MRTLGLDKSDSVSMLLEPDDELTRLDVGMEQRDIAAVSLYTKKVRQLKVDIDQFDLGPREIRCHHYLLNLHPIYELRRYSENEPAQGRVEH